MPKDNSKSATLTYLAKRVGIDAKNIIAFGDGENDREMLSHAGIGVAMGNASPSIQKWPRWSQIQMIMMGFGKP